MITLDPTHKKPETTRSQKKFKGFSVCFGWANTVESLVECSGGMDDTTGGWGCQYQNDLHGKLVSPEALWQAVDYGEQLASVCGDKPAHLEVLQQEDDLQSQPGSHEDRARGILDDINPNDITGLMRGLLISLQHDL